MADLFNDVITQYNVLGTTYDGETVRPLRPLYIFDASCKEKVWDRATIPTKGDTIVFPVLSAQSSNTAALDTTASTITGSQKRVYTRRTVSMDAYGDHMVDDLFEMRLETFLDDLSDTAFAMADQGMNSMNKMARAAMDLAKYSNEVSGTLSGTCHCYGSYGFGTTNIGPLYAKNVRAIKARLQARSVRPFPDGFYRAIIPAVAYTQLRGDTGGTGWTNTKDYINQNDMLIGDAGIFEGIRFITNDEVAGAGTGTLSCYFFGREWVGKAVGRDLKVATKSTLDGPHENLLTTYWDALIGYGLIRPEAGIICEITNVEK